MKHLFSDFANFVIKRQQKTPDETVEVQTNMLQSENIEEIIKTEEPPLPDIEDEIYIGNCTDKQSDQALCMFGDFGGDGRLEAAKTVFHRLNYEINLKNSSFFIVKKQNREIIVDCGRSSYTDMDQIKLTKNRMDKYSIDKAVMVCNISGFSSKTAIRMFAKANNILLLEERQFLALVARHYEPEINEMFPSN